jgi:hypothetical protein
MNDYFHTLMNYSESIVYFHLGALNFQTRFFSLFNAICMFSNEKENKMIKRLGTILKPFKEKLIENSNSLEIISFSEMKKLLESYNIKFKENDFEFLFYWLKRFKNKRNRIEMLDLTVISF